MDGGDKGRGWRGGGGCHGRRGRDDGRVNRNMFSTDTLEVLLCRVDLVISRTVGGKTSEDQHSEVRVRAVAA